jgi:broad specificity phosphatase PhoE
MRQLASQKHILVYLARHGTTDLNQQDAFRGPIDAPLDAKGRRDAHQLAYYFEPIDLAAMALSDRKRARETAHIIANHKQIPLSMIVENEGLRAWNVGDLGGQVKTPENIAFVDDHVKHPEVPLPGGESLNAFRARVRPLITEAIDIAIRVGEPVLLVAHSSVIHEVGTMVGGHHEYTLVEPGGVAAIYIENGKLDAEPIFKPRPRVNSQRAETIT